MPVIGGGSGPERLRPGPAFWRGRITRLFSLLPYRPNDIDKSDRKRIDRFLLKLINEINPPLSTRIERYAMFHCVLTGRNWSWEGKVTAARDIVRQGFNWDLLTPQGVVLGRSVWCTIGPTDRNDGHNFPVVEMEFEGKVLSQEQADRIKKRIFDLVGVGELRLSAYIFDLLMIHFGVDAIKTTENNWLAIKSPDCIKSRKLAFPV